MKVFISTYPFSRSSPEPLAILEKSGFEFIINPLKRKLTGQELFEHAKDCEAIIAGTEDLNVLVDHSKKLRLISRIGIGLDSVPLQKCLDKHIQVCYTPDAVTDAVAELTISLLIASSRQIVAADKGVREKTWKRLEGKAVKEMTIGLIGFGRIGKRVAELLTAFRPTEVLVNDLLDKSAEIEKLRSHGLNIRHVDVDTLIKSSDAVSLHLPYTNKSKNILSRESMQTMVANPIIINTARGGLIDEEALYDLLKSGRIFSAALDVFTQEPYLGRLAELDNITLTQHMGSCSLEARKAMESEAASDVIRFFRGERLQSPVHITQELEKLK